jgi:hypothetical protein
MNTSPTGRAAGAPAYYLGRPAGRWLEALRRSGAGHAGNGALRSATMRSTCTSNAA